MNENCSRDDGGKLFDWSLVLRLIETIDFFEVPN